MSFAAAHLDRLEQTDPLLYGRAVSIVRLAAKAWNCSMNCLIETWRSPEMDAVRSVLTVVLREQTQLSLYDIAGVLNREDHSSMQARIRAARRALMRKLDPVFRAYWSLIGYLRGRIELRGNPAIAEHEFEINGLDLSAYTCKPHGVKTAREIREAVAQIAGVDIKKLMGSGRRSRDIGRARRIVFFLFKVHLTGFSFPQMARAMQVSSHSSVISALDVLHREIVDEQDDEQLELLARCADELDIDLTGSLPDAVLRRASSMASPDGEFARTGEKAEDAASTHNRNHDPKSRSSSRDSAGRGL